MLDNLTHLLDGHTCPLMVIVPGHTQAMWWIAFNQSHFDALVAKRRSFAGEYLPGRCRDHVSLYPRHQCGGL
jgi:hypothetical protein